MSLPFIPVHVLLCDEFSINGIQFKNTNKIHLHVPTIAEKRSPKNLISH